MVGPIKTLYDLRQVEANILVICLACGHRKLVDREELIEVRQRSREKLDWSIVKASMICRSPSCSSENVRVETPAFSNNDRELRQRRAEVTLINLALKTLNEACYHKPPEDRRGAVRLALRVLHHHGHVPQPMLTDLWAQLAEDDGKAWNLSHQHMRWITKSLLDRRVPVWAELR